MSVAVWNILDIDEEAGEEGVGKTRGRFFCLMESKGTESKRTVPIDSGPH